jgi:hypothetical protein
VLKTTVTVDSRIPALLRQLEAAAGRVVLETAENIADRARASMQAPKHGRVYGAHQASAPGEAPAELSGDLIGSIGHAMDGATIAYAFATDDKAPWLEVGNGRVEARPAFVPAAEAEEPLFVDAMRDALGGLRG